MDTASMLKRIAYSCDRGQLIPLVALSLIVLMGAAALAVDVGYWRYQHRIEQTAADSAAIGGASEIPFTAAADVTTAAAQDATLNGYTDDGVNVKVQVYYPPQSGAYIGNMNAVEVIVQKRQSSFFARVLGVNFQWVSARAVALVRNGARNCVYGLNPTGTSVLINGSTVSIPNCGIVSDSNMIINGSTITAGLIGYAGLVVDNGSTYPNNGAHPTHALAGSDPCPSIVGCAYLKANPPNSGPCMSTTTYNGLGTATLQPGRYCSLVVINGCSNVVFQPGLYELDNGMTVNGVTNVSGNGVTFYNGGGQVVLNGSNVSLTAPATGNTKGVLFFQNPADSSPFTVNGSGGGYSGAMYFPSSQLTINGTLSAWLLLVGASVTVNGSGMNVPSSFFPWLGRAALAE